MHGNVRKMPSGIQPAVCDAISKRLLIPLLCTFASVRGPDSAAAESQEVPGGPAVPAPRDNEARAHLHAAADLLLHRALDLQVHQGSRAPLPSHGQCRLHTNLSLSCGSASFPCSETSGVLHVPLFLRRSCCRRWCARSWSASTRRRSSSGSTTSSRCAAPSAATRRPASTSSTTTCSWRTAKFS